MPYIYLIKPAEFIDTECYKVGLSSKCDLNRLKSYGAGTEYIQYFSCKNFEQAEKEIIFNLNQCVKSGKNIKLFKGREYFTGDKKTILKVFVKVMNKYVQMDLDNEENEAHEHEVQAGSKEIKELYKLNKNSTGLYECKVCRVETSNKYDFNKHLNTNKHKKLSESCTVCKVCFKAFTNKYTTARHEKQCVLKNQII
jgi:hypothetical protein